VFTREQIASECVTLQAKFKCAASNTGFFKKNGRNMKTKQRHTLGVSTLILIVLTTLSMGASSAQAATALTTQEMSDTYAGVGCSCYANITCPYLCGYGTTTSYSCRQNFGGLQCILGYYWQYCNISGYSTCSNKVQYNTGNCTGSYVPVSGTCTIYFASVSNPGTPC
jgi:hypothetical protein